MSDGIYWFTSPDVIAQKLSLGANQLEGEAEDIVRGITDDAAEFMRQRVETGGVEGGLFTGGPRADSWAMYDSIDSKTAINGRGRAQGEFGFIDNPPAWVKYHEYGTQSPGIGIKPLHAMADALFGAEGKMEVAAERSLERIWNNIWS